MTENNKDRRPFILKKRQWISFKRYLSNKEIEIQCIIVDEGGTRRPEAVKWKDSVKLLVTE